MNNYSTVSDIEKHSAAHVLATAVSRIFPSVKIGIGPVTKAGFYYDFDIPNDIEITPEAIKRIEAEIKQIIKDNLPFQQLIIPKDEAINLMLQKGQIYKAELIHNIPDPEISFFKTGEEFIDLCRGPHVNSTGELGPIKVTGVSQVYWNEDPARPRLTRLSGIIFKNEEEAAIYEKIEEEKASRSYIKSATQKGYGFIDSGMFHVSEKGSRIIDNLFKTITKELELDKVTTLSLNGQFKNIAELSRVVDKAVFIKEPSYKNFPITIVSRVPLSETIVKDKKRPSEVFYIKKYVRQNEVVFNISFVEKFIDAFNDIKPEFIVDIMFHNIEDPSFNIISSTLQRNFISHTKIQTDFKNQIEMNIKVKDDLKREWLMAQMNVNIENFDKSISFGSKVSKLGYIEFVVYPLNIFAFYLENKPILPAKFVPDQIVMVPVNKRFETYGYEVQDKLRKLGIRANIAYGNSSFKAKIRKLEQQNVPVILILGQKEVDNNAVSVRISDRVEGLISLENLSDYLKSQLFNK